MTEKYQLVNPMIEGTFDDTVKIKSGDENAFLEAAEKLWSRFSKHVSGNVPKFMFSIKNLETGKIKHFLVKEKVGSKKKSKDRDDDDDDADDDDDDGFDVDDKDVLYSIDELDIDTDAKIIDDYLSNIVKFNDKPNKKDRNHHKKHKDSMIHDSSSSSDSCEYCPPWYDGINIRPCMTS